MHRTMARPPDSSPEIRSETPTGGPAEFARVIRVADGRAVTLRAIGPEDARKEWEFVHRLSPNSKHFRFFTAINDLTPAMLERFTHPDYEREMALIAVTQAPQGEQEIGVARYAILPDARSCEFAIVVDDHWQGTGLARELMNALIEIAREHHHLEAMEGEALAENERMLWLARSLGFEIRMDPDDHHMIRMRRTL
jgi:acetyltransferase